MAAAACEQILIGTCDGVIDKRSNTSFKTNKLGDEPDPLPLIGRLQPICPLCHNGLAHIVQVYCPLAASSYHRTLNVFACTSPQCSGKPESWLALRSQCPDEDLSGQKVQQCEEPSRTDWCVDADDWGEGGDDDEELEKHAQAPRDARSAIKRNASEEQEVSRELHSLCIKHQASTFQPFFISVVDQDDLDGFHDDEHENRLLREYEEAEGVNVQEIVSCGSGAVDEKYEKGEAKHGDAVFTRFMKSISLCPQQVLRYNWAGTPLFITEPPTNIKETVSCCDHCGGPRVFEFQLMPAAVSLLITTDTHAGNSLEFGTVLVYTCKNSCWKSGSEVSAKEFIFVQPDPDQKLFK